MELGWDPAQVRVIDEDLGRSRASSSARSGFQALVADVGLGKVGLVLGIEMSRLGGGGTPTGINCSICAP